MKKNETKKAEETKAETKKSGVIVWQKALQPLRAIVNLAQMNAETISDKSIAEKLTALAKAERAKVEKNETIPARLNRRYNKFCLGKVVK